MLTIIKAKTSLKFSLCNKDIEFQREKEEEEQRRIGTVINEKTGLNFMLKHRSQAQRSNS